MSRHARRVEDSGHLVRDENGTSTDRHPRCSKQQQTEYRSPIYVRHVGKTTKYLQSHTITKKGRGTFNAQVLSIFNTSPLRRDSGVVRREDCNAIITSVRPAEIFGKWPKGVFRIGNKARVVHRVIKNLKKSQQTSHWGLTCFLYFITFCLCHLPGDISWPLVLARSRIGGPGRKRRRSSHSEHLSWCWLCLTNLIVATCVSSQTFYALGQQLSEALPLPQQYRSSNCVTSPHSRFAVPLMQAVRPFDRCALWTNLKGNQQGPFERTQSAYPICITSMKWYQQHISHELEMTILSTTMIHM